MEPLRGGGRDLSISGYSYYFNQQLASIVMLLSYHRFRRDHYWLSLATYAISRGNFRRCKEGEHTLDQSLVI